MDKNSTNQHSQKETVNDINTSGISDLDIAKECDRINKKLENIDENDLDEHFLEECLQEFRALQEKDPNFVSAYLGAAYVLGLLNRYDEAATTLAKAKTLDPTNNGIDEMIKQLDDLKLCESTQDEEEEEPHVPKLIEKGEFTPRFKEILTEIFDQFDEDKDGTWNDNEFAKYYQVVNGIPMPQTDLIYFKTNFETNDEGNLTREGFFQIYSLQTINGADETWKDLKQLGYNENLIKTEKK